MQKVNASVNKLENTEFYAGDMKNVLTSDFISQHGRPDVMIVDPQERLARLNSNRVECPICGKGHILKGTRQPLDVSRFREGCSLRLSFIDYPNL